MCLLLGSRRDIPFVIPCYTQFWSKYPRVLTIMTYNTLDNEHSSLVYLKRPISYNLTLINGEVSQCIINQNFYSA